MSWHFVSIGAEGSQVELHGVNLWAHPWLTQGELPIEVAHPNYPDQVCELQRYFVQTKNKSVEFAAGEVSAGLWLFHTQDANSEGRSILLFLGAYASVMSGTVILVHSYPSSAGQAALGVTLIALGIYFKHIGKAPRAPPDA